MKDIGIAHINIPQNFYNKSGVTISYQYVDDRTTFIKCDDEVNFSPWTPQLDSDGFDAAIYLSVNITKSDNEKAEITLQKLYMSSMTFSSYWPVGFSMECREYDACELCPPGKYNDEKGLIKCFDCAAGRYGLGGSQTFSCTGPCPAGFFSDPGSGNCTKCPAGKEHFFYIIFLLIDVYFNFFLQFR